MLSYKDILLLYDGNTAVFESMSDDFDTHRSATVMPVLPVEVSSFLSEKNTIYDGENFTAITNNLLKPWVENVPGDGEGEWIAIDVENTYPGFMQYRITGFLIVNGYVDFFRPHLFFANNRAKTLRIDNDKNNIHTETVLADTPSMQYVPLPIQVEGGNPRFTFMIKDVYKGTKWNDTCITMILPVYIQKETH